MVVINQEDYQNGKRLGFTEHESLFFVHGVGVSIEQYGVNGDVSIREQLGIKSSDVVITYIAELNHNKNHLFLLKNWKRILQHAPNVHCLIVGKGENEEALRRDVEQNGLQHIHFLGFRHDIPIILSESDIVTLLSFREGLPRCVMEAMASKKPLVVTNIRGSRDLVQHGVNGFVVDLGDDRALTESFVKLIREPNLREQMGQASFERIQPYRLENVLAEMDDVYSRYVSSAED
ncbi:glycosyltransferase [Geobacillus subterraneus]|uniref:glycosyltransferase n=1 Tax=Geobacillus subterraneus TaxID=129338 RepID=UPI0017D524FE